ncbi:hypothetical protein [Mycobacterium sp. 141]|uniref:hypothetical protein n=1 Tax=Mycobacterium sp. 141 TaxID=1120797 RepID=UPI00036A941E|nr:hypothetical protein [Mycobacterium sp. 141]
MSAADDPRPIVDVARAVHLCDVGMPGYLLAPCVATDGIDQIWIVDTACLADNNHRPPPPAHELIGRLPAVVRDRIWGDELRCGRPTSTGRPCRQRVKNPGGTCRRHAHLRRVGL